MANNNPYDVKNIPNELKENAYTVVRINETECNIESYEEMLVKRHLVVTILSEKGSYASNIRVNYTDGIDKIKNLNINIYNAEGKLVKKVKKKEITDVAVYDEFSMAQDLRALTYSSSYSNYPYTVEYEYEEESKYTAFILPWQPTYGYKSSVEYSKYKINAPSDFAINYKLKNFDRISEQVKIDPENFYFEARNIKAIEYEGMMPTYVLPYTMFSPSKSILDKTIVNYTDWKSFGKWIYDAYLNDKNNLSDEAIQEVKKTVSGLENDFDKAKAIFELAVNSTRYVSIQLGEGGWEPFYAQETHERKYGDCKALSMYTLSMMEKAGLHPFYVIIYGNSNFEQGLEKDFASIQGNHVIIGIPIEGDTIYADCTSSYYPFGFKSGFTDGRIALAIDKSGGKIVRTARYEDEENKEEILTKIEINTEQRLVNLNVQNIMQGLRMSNRIDLGQYTEKQILEKAYPYFYPVYKKETFENLTYELVDNKSMVESFNINSRNFISVAGDYLLLPLHIYENQLVKLDSKDRKFPFYRKDGFVKNYEYILDIPAGYQLGEMPEDVSVKSTFGEWSYQVYEISDFKLRFEVTLLVKSGTFENKEVIEYNEWIDNINQQLKNNIALKKK